MGAIMSGELALRFADRRQRRRASARYASEAEIARVLARARAAQARWREVPLAERARLCTRFVDAFVAQRDAIAREITLQMGRPIAHSPGELRGFEERARAMIALAPEALADVRPDAEARLHALRAPRAARRRARRSRPGTIRCSPR